MRAATEGTQHVYKYVSLNQSNASCNRTYVYNAVCLNQMSNESCNRTYVYKMSNGMRAATEGTFITLLSNSNAQCVLQ